MSKTEVDRRDVQRIHPAFLAVRTDTGVRKTISINRVVTVAQAGGYQHDPMAMSRVTGLVERYLSAQRELLRDDVECRSALREILDVFARAGSAEALRLIAQPDQLLQ